MTHLSDEQAAAIALGEADAAHEAHAAGCSTCAARVRACAEMLRDVAAIDVPEPPPLFWTQLANEVARAVDDGGRQRSGTATPARAWMAVAAALILAVAALLVSSRTSDPAMREAGPTMATGGPAPSLDDEDEAWAVVQSVAADVGYDDVHDAGIAPRPGAVERAAEELDDDERAEFVRLLQAEIKKLGV